MSRAHPSIPTWLEAIAALQAYVPTSERSIDVELAAARGQARVRHRKLATTGALMAFAAISCLLIFRGIFAQADINAELQALRFILFAVCMGLGINGLWFLWPGRLTTVTADCEQAVRDRYAPARGADLVIVNDLLTSADEARGIVRGWLANGSRLSVEDVQMLLRTYDAWLTERAQRHLTGTDRPAIAELADWHTRQAHAAAGLQKRPD